MLKMQQVSREADDRAEAMKAWRFDAYWMPGVISEDWTEFSKARKTLNRPDVSEDERATAWATYKAFAPKIRASLGLSPRNEWEAARPHLRHPANHGPSTR